MLTPRPRARSNSSNVLPSAVLPVTTTVHGLQRESLSSSGSSTSSPMCRLSNEEEFVVMAGHGERIAGVNERLRRSASKRPPRWRMRLDQQALPEWADSTSPTAAIAQGGP